MRLALVIVCLATATVGCAGRFERQMSQDLDGLNGHDIHAAIKKLGYPSREEVIAGDHVYRWVFDGGTTAVAYAPGALGVGMSKAHRCSIDVVVDASNIVTHSSWSGDRKGCDDIEDKLESD